MDSDGLLLEDTDISGEEAMNLIDDLPMEEEAPATTEKTFVCRICGKVFNSLADIGTHMKNDHSEAEREAVPSKWSAKKKKTKAEKGAAATGSSKIPMSDVFDEPMMEKLRAIMKAAGVKVRIDNIIDIFQHYEPTDLEKLGELLSTFDYSVPIRSAILENWSNYLGIEIPDEVIDDYMASRMRNRNPNIAGSAQSTIPIDPLDKIQLEEEQELVRDVKRGRVELKIEEQRKRMKELKHATDPNNDGKDEQIVYVPDASGNMVPVKASMFNNSPFGGMMQQQPKQDNREVELLKEEMRLLREETARKDQEKQMNNVMGYVDEKMDAITKLLEQRTQEDKIHTLTASFETKLDALTDKMLNNTPTSTHDDYKLLDTMNNLRSEIGNVSKDVDTRMSEMQNKTEMDALRSDFSTRLDQINSSISRRYATDAATAEIQESAGLLREGIGSVTTLGQDIVALEARKSNLLGSTIPDVPTTTVDKKTQLPQGTENIPIPQEQHNTSQELRAKLDKLKAWRANK